MRFRRKQTTTPKTPEVYAFIDSQNLNLGIQRAGWKMDWRKFREMLRNKYGVTKAYMFIGYVSKNEDMYNQLHEAGYMIVLKPTVEMSTPQEQTEDSDYKPTIKGNIDAELVLYAMKEMPNYSQAIIVSGDGDFYCLAEYLDAKKRLRNIMTPNWKYSTLLKPFEDKIIRLDQKRAELEHKDRNWSKKKKTRRQPTAV